MLTAQCRHVAVADISTVRPRCHNNNRFRSLASGSSLAVFWSMASWAFYTIAAAVGGVALLFFACLRAFDAIDSAAEERRRMSKRID